MCAAEVCMYLFFSKMISPILKSRRQEWGDSLGPVLPLLKFYDRLMYCHKVAECHALRAKGSHARMFMFHSFSFAPRDAAGRKWQMLYDLIQTALVPPRRGPLTLERAK